MNLSSHLTAGLAFVILAPAALAQNDECTTAIALTAGTAVAFDTTTATLSAEPWPCAFNGGPDLWYSIASVAGGALTVETCGSSYDTSLEIFSGACGALTSVICNDDTCGLQSTVVLSGPTTGTTYYVRVGGYAGNTGAGTILLTEAAPPLNNVQVVDNVPGMFIDISTTGTALGMADDEERDITTTVGNSLLAAGTVRIGSNGAVRFQGTGLDLAFTNQPIPSTAAFSGERSLMPFWDDVDTNGGIEGEIYWQETGGMLIIQWEDVEFYPGGSGGVDTATFQVQVHASGSPIAQFVYESVDSARADMGGSATIGFQSEDETLNNTAQWSYNTPGAVSNGDVISIVTGPVTLGMNYCTANPNSTGGTGAMSAAGSSSAAANDVTLTASGLPSNSFGFFITSQTQGFVANPNGSFGNLCVGGAIGRYVGPGQIQNTMSTDEFSLALDLPNTPSPTGFISVAAGETWNFQAWHRDLVMGTVGSNFTDGLSILFN